VIDAAIVGMGRWGRSLVEAVHDRSGRIRFVLGVDPSPGNGDYAQSHGLAFAETLAGALSDLSVRAVVLATPHSLHREQVISAARAGKHVFCEKPLALSAADAKAMLEACNRTGVQLAVGHNRRFWPAMQRLKQLVAGGALGRLLHIEGHNSNENSNRVSGGWRTSPAESPGGGFTGAGLHVLDSFVYLFGPVRRVCAQLRSYHKDIPPLDAMSALYEFHNGCSGTLATVRATPFYWRVHVFGSAGSAEVLGETELVLRMSGKPQEHIACPPADALLAELEAFADAVEGRCPYPISPDDMVATVGAFEATLRSLEAGGAPTPV
jgi:predicted dehydrogenase